MLAQSARLEDCLTIVVCAGSNGILTQYSPAFVNADLILLAHNSWVDQYGVFISPKYRADKPVNVEIETNFVN